MHFYSVQKSIRYVKSCSIFYSASMLDVLMLHPFPFQHLLPNLAPLVSSNLDLLQAKTVCMVELPNHGFHGLLSQSLLEISNTISWKFSAEAVNHLLALFSPRKCTQSLLVHSNTKTKEAGKEQEE